MHDVIQGQDDSSNSNYTANDAHNNNNNGRNSDNVRTKNDSVQDTHSSNNTQDAFGMLSRGHDLGYDQMYGLAMQMLEGRTDDAYNAKVLKMLCQKGETDEELLAMLGVMEREALHIHPKTGNSPIIDVCGTGGDMHHTFNISTAAAFVVTAASSTETSRATYTAKHGNYSSTGISGSADIFEALGYDNNAEPARVQEILERNCVCFLFAQKFHPSMRYVAAARQSLKPLRTAFNLLGPLANPAPVYRQLVGVSSKELLYRIPRLLLKRGIHLAMTVTSADGMDEMSTSSSNMAVFAEGGGDGGAGRMFEMTIKPEDVGLCRSDISDIKVASRSESVRAVVGAIDGTAPRAVIETTVINAAGALMVAGMSDDIKHAVEVCYNAISGGAASNTLDGFVKHAGRPDLLEEIRHGM